MRILLCATVYAVFVAGKVYFIISRDVCCRLLRGTPVVIAEVQIAQTQNLTLFSILVVRGTCTCTCTIST